MMIRSLNSLAWPTVAVATTLLCGSHSTLMTLSKEDGVIRYRVSSAVFLTDIIKLAISLCLLTAQRLKASPAFVKTQAPIWLLAFCVPAFLGVVNNHIAHYAQQFLDPVSYQLLGNAKIVTTAVLYWMVMGKAIGFRKRVGIAFMVVSGVCNSLASQSHKAGQLRSDRLLVTPIGILLMAILCTISGVSSVFLEFLMKRNQHSIFMQNILLYSFASTFTGSALLQQYISESNQAGFLQFLLHGFSIWTWVSIVSQVVAGLLMGVVLKFSGNLLRLIILACGVPVASVLGVLCFSLQLNSLFGLAVLLLFLALYFYNTNR